MDFNKIDWQKYFTSVKGIFTNKKTVKSARVSYNVFWNLLLIFIIVSLIGISFAGGAGAGYFASLVKDEPIRPYESMKKDIYNYEETTELYFANNIYLGKLRSDLDREEVDIDNVSEYLKNAIIATEDEYFNDHNGVVPKAILRALFQEVTNSSVRTGGSTLTQQLIKNQILTSEVSFSRKAKEILLALRLEKSFNKDEILEAYLNVATFGRNSSGRNIAGVQTAAKGIFGVDASDLNIPQAAFIAGLPQSPFGYTPFTNTGELKENLEPGLNRMETVLDRMLSAEVITEDQYEDAITYDIVADFAPPTRSPVEQYPWITFEIEQRATEVLAIQLAKDEGYEEEDLETNDALYNDYMARADKNLRQNGYKIYSTIDKDIYDQMQEVKNNYEYYGSDKPETVIDPDTGEEIEVMEPVEVGALLLENKTGRIISFVGGRDYQREQLNHATSAERPNGSTMKPLLAYAPAMELGKVQPGSVIADVPVRIRAGDGSIWEPENYTGRFYGLTSARYALQQSYNIPAIKTYQEIINQRPVTFLEKMGFSSLTEGDAYNLSLTLGALTNGVTVEENINAFATFSNYGSFVDAYMIDKIVTNDGDVIYEHESKQEEVFSPQTSYLTLDMLRDVVQRGTAAALPGQLSFNSDWVGKTGTGQDYKDAWFVGTNPNVTFGVWIGYDTPKPLEIRYKGLSYGIRNIYLWAQLMNAAYDVNPELIDPEERFKMPGGIVRRSYCAVSGLIPSDLCREAGLVEEDIFNVKYVPTKVDDSLEKGKYVSVDDKKYRALDTTPDDFSLEGIMLTKEFLKENNLDDLEDLSELIPDREKWENITIPENDDLEENGIIPAEVNSLQLKSNVLTWRAHTEKDIIGYRIYQTANFSVDFELLASIPVTEELIYKVNNSISAYYITAIDIAGNESSPSNVVKQGEWFEIEPIDNEDEQDQDPTEPPNNGNGNGDSGDGNTGTDGSNTGDSDDSNTGIDGSDTGDSGDDSSDTDGSSTDDPNGDNTSDPNNPSDGNNDSSDDVMDGIIDDIENGG